MSNLDQLIETCEILCRNLDKSIASDKFFTDDINFSLEKMSWDAFRMIGDLREIQNYIGR